MHDATPEPQAICSAQLLSKQLPNTEFSACVSLTTKEFKHSCSGLYFFGFWSLSEGSTGCVSLTTVHVNFSFQTSRLLATIPRTESQSLHALAVYHLTTVHVNFSFQTSRLLATIPRTELQNLPKACSMHRCPPAPYVPLWVRVYWKSIYY